MFEHRLKSHHELYNITRALATGRMEVEEYLKTRAPGGAGPGGMAASGGMTAPSGIASPGGLSRAVLYLHIPFCRKICRFCNMLRMPGAPPEDYARLLIREMERYQGLDYIRSLTFEAVYFGGGTPTTLDPEALQAVLASLRKNFRMAEDAEITFESTVTELTEEKMRVLKECGVNRLSIGIQTFSDRGRRMLGRTGTGKEAYEKLLRLKTLGIENVNIDVIYHYPGQSMKELDEDLKKVFSLDLGSFSFYSLISDPVPSNMDMEMDFKETRKETGGRMTSLSRETEREGTGPGGVEEVGGTDSGETEQALFDRIYSLASDQGFSLMELTKMARHDRYCYISARHDGADTLALGAGAGGKLGNITYMNPISLERYRSLVDGEPAGAGKLSGILTGSSHAAVSRLTGDLQRGRLPLDTYRELFGGESLRLLSRLLSEGYLETGRACSGNGIRYRLTQKGVYWGNNICDAFLKSIVAESMQDHSHKQKS